MKSKKVTADKIKYSGVKPSDTKQKGDEFNLGLWELGKSRWVKSTMPNGNMFGAWYSYYRRPITSKEVER
jgi:hypothetical protein